ncbi:hypothetical protein [Pseudonocardia parietis]|uniref:Uncharacterized protein n=1 Tax=Pseudonocardia parietis TaxID=570936 RepID=A0ABS4W7G6_9PSEU|nr:hypothetical protein [Pseudonocardia parietis]MBP2371873.1 hypothetical protein [Pseudonocardia parietis]
MTETSPLTTGQGQRWLREVREGRDEEPEDPWTRQAPNRQQETDW